MEVGIRKREWRMAWRYPAYLWSLRWVYAVKKTRRLVYAVYPRIPPNTPLHTHKYMYVCANYMQNQVILHRNAFLVWGSAKLVFSFCSLHSCYLLMVGITVCLKHVSCSRCCRFKFSIKPLSKFGEHWHSSLGQLHVNLGQKRDTLLILWCLRWNWDG